MIAIWESRAFFHDVINREFLFRTPYHTRFKQRCNRINTSMFVVSFFDGVKFITGISIFLNSYVSGNPDAFASTITVSGCQYLYCSSAKRLSSGNSYRPLIASSNNKLAGSSSMDKKPPCRYRTVIGCLFFKKTVS